MLGDAGRMDDHGVDLWAALVEADDERIVGQVSAVVDADEDVGRWLAALWAALAPTYGLFRIDPSRGGPARWESRSWPGGG